MSFASALLCVGSLLRQALFVVTKIAVFGTYSFIRRLPPFWSFSTKGPREGSDWPGLGLVAREYGDLIGQVLGMYSLLEPEGGFERGRSLNGEEVYFSRGRWAKR